MNELQLLAMGINAITNMVVELNRASAVIMQKRAAGEALSQEDFKAINAIIAGNKEYAKNA